ncbi:MAG TPA: hypothetical protein VEX37_12695, partial [Thermomicrobiales bacterium]|nr:hypothetical protein [Thermomicrobiales bacterium]
HGGLGGPQTTPFVLYPTDLPLDPERDIIGASALHDVLVSWVTHLSSDYQDASDDTVRADRLLRGAG